MNIVTYRTGAAYGLIACLVSLTACRSEAPTAQSELGVAETSAVQAAAELPGRVERGGSEHYEFAFRYLPEVEENPVMVQAIKEFADLERKHFVEFVAGDGEEIDPPPSPWSLEITFSRSLKSAFIETVEAEGYGYTGGAHGFPVIARFNYFRASDQVMALQDLFSDSAALEAISTHSRSVLLEQFEVSPSNQLVPANDEAKLNASNWITAGTEPLVENFALYEPSADEQQQVIGLRILFPPYQVSSYADGMREVHVPTAIFATWLKPEFRSSFGLEPESGP